MKNNPKNTSRLEKVAEEIRREVSTIILYELSDPRVSSVTVTAVKMSPDLSLARVYFTLPGQAEKKEEALKGLRSAAGAIRKLVAGRIVLKFMPQFDFYYDESLELQDRIDSLFEKIHSSPDTIPSEDE
ncbi:MAG: 30S ribosome-binding factor RbfA [Deltaproteobacteria bacterium]|nr:30S ribosome-binding factor RbfA [Deltaproteobacteria bacterium]